MIALAPALRPEPTGSFVFASRSGGRPHEVSERTAVDGNKYLTCTCPGGRFAWAGKKAGTGCWAMQAVRAEKDRTADELVRLAREIRKMRREVGIR